MKILYTTDGFPLPDMPGGARYYQVAKWLQANGHSVTVLCNARNYLTEAIAFTGTVEHPQDHDGISIIGLYTPSGRHRSKIQRVALYVMLMIQTYLKGRRLPPHDLVIAGTPPLLMPLAALMLARKHKAPAILEVRDLHPQMSIAAGIIRKPWLIWPWRIFEETLRKKFDHIVAAVPRMREMIAREGNDPDKVTVITSGYDLENDQQVALSPAMTDYFERNAGKRIVGYTGNMGRGAWNIKGMVEAAALLRDREDVAFLFIGDGEQKRVCEDIAREQGLSSCTFFSSIGRLEVANVMRKCDVLMMAYHDNPFYKYIIPIKLFDYMGAGKPIVFSGDGDGPDLLEKADGGTIMRRFDAGQFARAIIELVDDSALAQKLGQRNRAYVEANLLREQQFAKWRDAIAAAVASHGLADKGAKTVRKTV